MSRDFGSPERWQAITNRTVARWRLSAEQRRGQADALNLPVIDPHAAEPRCRRGPTRHLPPDGFGTSQPAANALMLAACAFASSTYIAG